MDWFQGEIPNAIQTAKTTHSLIIVYINGEDNKSKECDALWEANEVVNACKKNSYVALKLAANSDSCKQFSAIYPVVVIPCTFLISDNGVPIDIIACETDADTLVRKLKDAFTKHEANKTTRLQAGGAPPLLGGGEHEIDSANLEKVGASIDSSPAENYEEPKLSKEERIQRAKDLAAERRAAKILEDKEKERRDELARRDLGRTAAHLAQRKQEAELLESRKQWLKDKEADVEAREKVRAQIAMDRAEKMEVFRKEKESKNKEKRDRDEAKRAQLDENEKLAQQDEARRRRESARIQFRLPDGSSITHTFPAQNELRTADAFISQHTESQPGALTLSTLYPRRTFTHQDMKETLEDLGLSPSAVIMVIYTPHSLTAAPSSTLSTFLSFITAPLSLIWNFFYGVFFGFSTPTPTYRPNPPSSSVDQGTSLDDGSTIDDLNSSRDRRQIAYKRRTANTGASNTDGNIHRLTRPNDDSDDDNATWNGNSTQQM